MVRFHSPRPFAVGSVRTCTKCRRSVPDEAFNRRLNGALKRICKDCQSAYHKAHYRANKTAANARRYRNQIIGRARLRRLIDEAKAKPCGDCERSYPPHVMQFDHVRGKKLFTIGDAVRLSIAVALVVAEIEKCDVVCANCHADRTHRRRRIYRV